jgi:hypothetical protein
MTEIHNLAQSGSSTSGQVVRLVGAAEAAALLGVLQQNLRPIPNLPAPVAILKCGTIWLAEDIEAFAASRQQVAA